MCFFISDYLAVFENNIWSAVGAGGINQPITTIFIKDNLLYIGGLFDEIGGLSLPYRIATYKNGAWVPVDVYTSAGAGEYIYSLIITNNNNLYIGGNFDTTTTYACDQKTVSNSSNTNVYPTIEILGPGVLQSITNYTTNKAITFDGLTLQSGERITIKTNPSSCSILSREVWGEL